MERRMGLREGKELRFSVWILVFYRGANKMWTRLKDRSAPVLSFQTFVTLLIPSSEELYGHSIPLCWEYP